MASVAAVAAASRRIRVGVVGLSTQGWASWGLVPSILKIDNNPYDIVATCTSRVKTEEEINTLKSKYGQNLKIYSDPNEMAKDGEIDVIVVSVKAPDHVGAVTPALDKNVVGEKKKNVFIEWPACSSAKICETLAGNANQLGVRVMVGLQGRQSPVLKKLNEIIKAENGEKGIGRIISSSLIGCAPEQAMFWGPKVSESSSYITDIKSGATMLHIMTGHLLDSFLQIFGDISSVSTIQTIAFPQASVIDKSGNTIKTVPVTSPDQIAFSGLTKSNIIFNFHYRAGLSMMEGRTNFVWHIDGTEGSVRLEGDGGAGSFINIRDPTLYLNGRKIDIPEDPLGKIGRAWAEFTKGREGNYATMEDAVKVHRVMEAVMESGEKGVRVNLN